MHRDQDIARNLESRSAEIVSRLTEFLRTSSGTEQTTDANDLLFLLLERLRGAVDTEDRLEALILRVNRPDHSIADLHGALVALKRSIVEILNPEPTPHAAVLLTHQILDELFDACLERTALVHELIMESSRRAYCEVDVAGHIINANKAMRELLRLHNCRGLHLVDFFPGNEEHIERSFAGDKSPQIRRMHLRLSFGDVPVSTEFGSLRFRGCVRGGYAVMVDVSNFVAAEQKAFETSRFGILRVAPNGRITYANPQAAEILGQDQAALCSTTFRSFFPDTGSQAILDRETENRKRGQGSRYNLSLPRPNRNKPISLQVDATPEFDVDGTFISSFVVLQSLHLQHAFKAIHGICESGKRAEKIVADVLGIVKDFVPYDFATFSVYTPDAKFARVASFFPPPKPPWDTLWFPVTPNLLGWLLGPSPWAPDLQQFLQKAPVPEDVAESPTVRRLVAEGYHSFMCYPLCERGRLAAVLTFFSKQVGFYEARHHRLLKEELGVEAALRVAFHALQRAEQTFLLRLAQMVDSTASLREVAQKLVHELSRFYGWQNVSIFKVNRVRHRVELLAQASGKVGGYFLPARYQQPLDKGVLGYVARLGRPVNLSDVRGDKLLSDVYVASNSDTSSELCLPIMHDGDIYWLLNLEDRRLNAFAPPEVSTLERVIAAVEAALARLFDGRTFEEIFSMSSDGVVIVDLEGSIVRCNPAAEQILQEHSKKLQNLQITDFIDDSEVKQRIVTDRDISQAKTMVTGKQGQQTSVLINGGILPDEYNRKVLFLKDLTEIALQRDLRFASAAMTQLSSETRIPLALASSLMQTAGRSIQSPERFMPMIKQAIAQIGKVEMTYDRLIASCDRQRLPQLSQRSLDLTKVIRRALEQLDLPAGSSSSVEVDVPTEPIVVRADSYQLAFVIKSILTFILRAASPDRPVKVSLRPAGDFATVRVVGLAPQLPDSNAPRDPITDAEEEARGRVILAEPVLQQIVEVNHRGKFKRSRPTPETDCFELQLPIATPARSDRTQSGTRALGA